jgi:hypothetical protein
MTALAVSGVLTGNGTFAAVLAWAQEGKGSDPNGYRSGFSELVRQPEALKRR